MPWCRNSCPTPEEQRLYDLVSEYLQQPTLYALPASQRSLMTLILRKLLASSTYAISDTLSGLACKLEMAAAQAEKVDAPPEELADNWEEIDELADEWEPDEETNGEPERPQYTPEQIADMRQEMAKLREFHALARSIAKNSKGEVLLTALRRGFAAAAEGQAGTHRGNPPAKGRHLHRVAPHAGIPFPHPGADRVSRQGHGVQRHEHRPQVQGNLSGVGSRSTPAPTASPAPRPPTCVPPWSITSATRRPS